MAGPIELNVNMSNNSTIFNDSTLDLAELAQLLKEQHGITDLSQINKRGIVFNVEGGENLTFNFDQNCASQVNSAFEGTINFDNLTINDVDDDDTDFHFIVADSDEIAVSGITNSSVSVEIVNEAFGKNLENSFDGTENSAFEISFTDIDYIEHVNDVSESSDISGKVDFTMLEHLNLPIISNIIR
jgi:hypothetical protein